MSIRYPAKQKECHRSLQVLERLGDRVSQAQGLTEATGTAGPLL